MRAHNLNVDCNACGRPLRLPAQRGLHLAPGPRRRRRTGHRRCRSHCSAITTTTTVKRAAAPATVAAAMTDS